MTATSPIQKIPKKQRKPLVHIVPSPIRKLVPRSERTTRSVYIVARPIKKAGKLSFLSERSLPLCHWGLLVSPYTKNELCRHLKKLSHGDCNIANNSWGTLFEIYQTEQGFHELQTISAFGPSDWEYMCLVYVAQTQLPNYRIKRQGAPFL
jgi:hypothetical protein